MKPHIENIKLNFSQLNNEKLVNRKKISKVIREITLGAITTEELLKFLRNKN